jgi:branched-chain amino acid transport system substrate-binding protein
MFGALVGPTQAAEAIKIGVLTPLSPPGDASAGQLIVRGAKLAVEYVKAQGGIRGGQQIAVVVEDDAGTPEKGVAGYRKLATRDRVVAVIGQFHSSVMLAVSPLAERIGVPIFSTQASARAITEKHFVTTFRTHAIDPDRTRVWLRFIKDQGFKRIAILAENTDYGVGLIEETKAQNNQKQLGLTLKPVIFDRGTVDLTPQLLELKAWKADLLINVGVGASAYLIIKQAYDIGLFPATPMLASYDFPVRPEYWNNLGEKGKYLLYISYYHPRMQITKLGQWFQEHYQAQYNEPPVYTTFNAFGQVVIISQALDRAASAKPADLIAALESGEYLSWNGKVRFSRGEGPYWHQWSPPLLILQYTQTGQQYKAAPILFPPEMKTGNYLAPR